MFASQYEEHLAHSAPCNSRWDGFDRGDNGDALVINERTCIGRMTGKSGARIAVTEHYCEDASGSMHWYTVAVNGEEVFGNDNEAAAIEYARRQLN